MSDTARVSRPVVVPIAIALLVLASALNVLSSVRLIADGVGAASVVGVIIGLGLAFLVLRGIYLGRNWARIFPTVVAALGTVLLILGLATGAFGYTWLDLIGQAIVDAAVVLLWLPVTNQYFAAAKHARVTTVANSPES